MAVIKPRSLHCVAGVRGPRTEDKAGRFGRDDRLSHKENARGFASERTWGAPFQGQGKAVLRPYGNPRENPHP